MAEAKALRASVLRQRCDHKRLGFKTTAELKPAERLLGQDRARDAMQFGTAIRRTGYNLFVIGERGLGHQDAVVQFLEERARSETPPDEWVYVNNFQQSRNPIAIRLPAGTATDFRRAMDELIDDLKSALPGLFDSDDYRTRLRAIDDEAKEEQEQAFENLRQRAEAESITIMRTPMGFALAPTRDGTVIQPDVFNAMHEEDKKRIEAVIAELQGELEHVLRELPAIDKRRRDRIRKVNEELASATIGASIAVLRQRFAKHRSILDHLQATQADLVHNLGLFVQDGASEEAANKPPAAIAAATDRRLRRYGVNVLVTDGRQEGAAVVSEEHPTLANLLGHIEHLAELGALVTDFTLIKPGALHRANGGYIVLDARKLLSEAYAWEALKRTLRGNAIRIESAASQMGLATTLTLDPQPIPLNVKVVLVGERRLYDTLVQLDPDFSDLFKVEADFEDRWQRNARNEKLSARLFATIIDAEGLLPLTSDGAALLIEESARFSDDSERLSLRIGYLTDLLQEADFWAKDAGNRTINAGHIEQALAGRIRRKDRIRQRVYEGIERNTVLIDTKGVAVGQINGLSVTGIGDFMFGKPSRITARVRMGGGKLIDIEREVDLGGPLHSKGVMILASYLQANYALDRPVSLWASLAFEQSYGGVDGDSASSAELYALLSALSEVPIRQDLAVTGSVNQRGEVQAIGGVNEKIEGFFDICRARGLTGSQGVLIPKSNVKHLMLRQDVVDAAQAGQFHVYSVRSIDEGIAILTGQTAGRRNARGLFPAGSINGLVDARLAGFADARRDFAARKAAGGNAAEDSPS